MKAWLTGSAVSAIGMATPPAQDAPVRGAPGRVYNIGGGTRVSLREVFDLIPRVSGRKVTILEATKK
jgi:nucleoside-diphosphate-sugar epimerase